MTVTTTDIIKAAASVGRDVAEGKIDPAALDQAVADECRELFGTVVGEGDSLWPLHCDVARQVLAAGGLSADELSEWLAVARHRAGEPLSASQAERPPIDPPADTSADSETQRPEIDVAQPDLSAAVVGVVTSAADSEAELSPEQAASAGDGEPEPEIKQAAPATDTNTSLMVTLPDGRRIPRRLIAARGRGVPTDNGLREF